MPRFTLLIYSKREDFTESTIASLKSYSDIEVVAVVSDSAKLNSALAETAPDFLIADLLPDPPSVVRDLEAIPGPRPLLLASGPQDDSKIILSAMQAGARAYLPPNFEASDLFSALDRTMTLQPEATPKQRSARIIVVMGSKGGVGATSVACQLGFELSRLGQDTAIVDFNLPLGDVALYYDLQPQRTIAHLTKGDLDVDLEYIEMILQNHASGLRILAAPLRVEESQVISPQHLSSALETLRSRFDWIVVDISRRWGEECVRALDMASQILVVCTLDIPTLNHTKNHLELMERLGLSASAVRLIANRHSSKQTVTERDVIEFLGRSPDAKLSNDFPAMAAAINEGRAIHEVAPRSPLAADFRTLTSLIHDWCGIEYPANQKRRGFWGALRRPKEGS